ncbi:hypothetical protein HY489_03920 [Candidatus Woesearchaeota archaeon]|nr:hypothetical protein [Candidatus Woesearchaeota archaeon]
MADEDLRLLECRARETGDRADYFAFRHELKRAGKHGGLDLSLRGGYAVAGAGRNPTYSDGVVLLRKDCKSEVVGPHDDLVHPFYAGEECPLLFSETLDARLDCPDGVLWNTFLNTFSGVLCKGKRPDDKDEVVEFKIVPLAVELLGLQGVSVPVSFDTYGGEVFRTDEHRCNVVLSSAQARSSKVWLAAAGYNQDRLDRYVVRAEREARQRGNDLSEYFMNFWVLRKKPETDQLWPLVLSDGYYSVANGYDSVSYVGRFARVRPLSMRAEDLETRS